MSVRPSPFCDLEITLEDLDREEYLLRASSPVLRRDARHKLSKADVRERIEPLVEEMHKGVISKQDTVALGRALFEVLLQGEVREAYRYLEGTLSGSQRLRLLLNIEPAELRRLPWECLYDPWRDDWVGIRGRDEDHSKRWIIRYIKRPERETEAATDPLVDIAVAISCPPDKGPVVAKSAKDEWRLLEKALGDLVSKGPAHLIPVGGEREDVRQALAHDPQVFHFIGHGGIERGVPGLYLEEGGSSYFEGASELVHRYFAPPGEGPRRLRYILLSACQTAETPQTEGYASLAHQLAGRVEAVVAMQYPITRDNASKFNEVLYKHLAAGAPLEEAVSFARQELISDKPRGRRDWIAPVVVSHGIPQSGFLEGKNPFVGAKPYDKDDRSRFYGREKDIDRLTDLLFDYDHRSIVIWGLAGCGKTSLLRAGLMPWLEDHGRPFIYETLAQDVRERLQNKIEDYLLKINALPPKEEDLFGMLHRLSGEPVFVLDQVEQAEHLGEWAKELVRGLIGWVNKDLPAAQRARLVLATREDEEGKVAEWLYGALPGRQESCLELKPLDRDNTREIIKLATDRKAVEFSSRAITQILEELNYENDRNMMKVQIVCRALHSEALKRKLEVVEPELVLALGGVDGILAEHDIQEQLSKAGEKARPVLAQFVRSDGSARERRWEELHARSGATEEELYHIVRQLEDLGLVRRREIRLYELVHETFADQFDVKKKEFADLLKLGGLEEIVENAGVRIQNEDLEKLYPERDKLRLTVEEQQLVLYSALEADHECDRWLEWAGPTVALDVLKDRRLSPEARIRAAGCAGLLAEREDGDSAKEAKVVLRDMAVEEDSPELNNKVASLALAEAITEKEVVEFFDKEPQKKEAIAALAWMFDSKGIPLSGLSQETRRRVRRQLLRQTAPELLSTVVPAGALVMIGFALATTANRTADLILKPHPYPQPFLVVVLSLILSALLTCMLAAPGAALLPLSRDLSTILAGGRRRTFAALGAVAGSILGLALTLFVISILVQIEGASPQRLLKHTLAGALWGAAIGVTWVLASLLPVKRKLPAVLAAGVVGAAAVYLSDWTSLWPTNAFLLTPPERAPWLLFVIGGIVGVASAAGMAWRQLRSKP